MEARSGDSSGGTSDGSSSVVQVPKTLSGKGEKVSTDILVCHHRSVPRGVATILVKSGKAIRAPSNPWRIQLIVLLRNSSLCYDFGPVSEKERLVRRAPWIVVILLAACELPGSAQTIRSLPIPVLTARSLAADRQGSLYFTISSDGNADRVYRLDASAKSKLVAGNGTAGSRGDDGPAVAAQLDIPDKALLPGNGLAVDGDGNVFVADMGNSTVRRVDASSGVITSVVGRWARPSTSDLPEPVSVALDRAGNLFIADYGRNAIFILNAQTQQLALIAQVAMPGALVVDPAGANIYVALPWTGQVLRIEAATGTQNMFAGGAGFIPQADGAPAPARVDGVPASSASLRTPLGLALDGAGNLFISEAERNVVRRVDASTGIISTIAGTGEAGNVGDGGPAVAAKLNRPTALVFDRRGNLFIVDSGNNAIREVEHAGVPFNTVSSGVALQPGSLTFGPQPVAGMTSAQTIVLTNNTSSAVSISGLSFTGANPSDFSQANSCGLSVADGASCNINVTFTPHAAGARTATLNVIDSDPSSPQTVSLTGTGDDYELTAASGGSLTATVTSGATASYSLAVTPDMTFSGTVTLSCPLANTLPTDATCTVNPTTVNVTAGSPAPFSVMIATKAASLPPPRPDPGPKPLFPALLAAFLIGAALLLRARRSRPVARADHFALRFSIQSLLVAALLFLAGCYSSPKKLTTTTTPTGTYMVTINGNAQNATRAVTLTLIVQ